MDALENALEHALVGRASAFGFAAEPGVGKSRLCFEFLEYCRARDIRIQQAHAVAYGKSMPFLPVLEYLRRYFGVEQRDDEETARDKIAGRAVRLSADLYEDVPVLLDFLGSHERGVCWQAIQCPAQSLGCEFQRLRANFSCNP